MQRFRLVRFSIIVFIVLVTILLHYLGVLRPIEKFLRSFINPSSQVVYEWSVQIADENQQFNSVEALQEAYTEIALELVSSTVDQAALSLLKEENEELRKQLNYIIENDVVHVGADVIGRNIEALGNTFVINRGSDSGLKVGDPALVQSGILVGKVIRVEEDTSIVQLLSDTQSRVAATVLNDDRSLGVVEGGFGLSVRMNFIPQNETVRIGDTIVTSGLEEQVPRGLVIGSVEAVEKEPFQPFQRAIVTPEVDLNRVRVLTILTQL